MMLATETKILTLDELSAKAKEYRDAGQKVVLCHGAFDLLHAGHIRYLKTARNEGDVLLVTVTADDGESITFGAGDLVTFNAGLSCTWHVKSPLKKYYKFG